MTQPTPTAEVLSTAQSNPRIAAPYDASAGMVRRLIWWARCWFSGARMPVTRLLVLSFGSLTVISVALVLWLALGELRRGTISLANERADRILARVEQVTQDIIMPVDRTMRVFTDGVADGRIDVLDQRQLETALSGALFSNPQLTAVGFVTPDLKVFRVARDGQRLVQETVGRMSSLEDSLRRAATSRRPEWIAPFYNRALRQTVLQVRYPVYDENDRLAGLLVPVMGVGTISSYLTALSQNTGHTAFILYNREWVLAHPYLDTEFDMGSTERPLPRLDDLADPVLSSIWQEHRSALPKQILANQGVGKQADLPQGEFWFLYRDLQVAPEVYWTLGTYFEGTPVDREIQRLRAIAMVGMGILLTALFLAVLVGKRVSRPILHFAEAAERVRQGELDALPPLARTRIKEFDVAARAFNEMVAGLKDRERIRDLFGRYVPNEVADRLLHDPARLSLAGERREVSLMFTDIAGFTSVSESHAPETVFPLLNQYLEGVCGLVAGHGGIVIDFIGDAVFAVFGAPESLDNHAASALAAARAIDAFGRRFAEDRQRQNIPWGVTRIGINSGTATVGNVGSEARMKYGVTGDVVNTASRLEGANKLFGTSVIASAATVSAVKDTACRPLGPVMLRGRSEPVTVYEILPADPAPAERERIAHYCAAFTAPGIDALTDYCARHPGDSAARTVLTARRQGEIPLA